VSKWVPFSARGMASSIVSLGGRIGGALAPVLTAYLITSFVPVTVSSEIAVGDVLNAPSFYQQIATAAEPSKSSERTADPSPKARKAAAVRSISGRVYEVLSPEGREALRRFRVRHDQALARKIAGRPATSSDSKGSKPALAAAELEPLLDASDRAVLAGDLNLIIHAADFYEPVNFAEFDLPSEAKRYRAVVDAGGALPPEQLARFNRLLLEAVYPAHIKKVYGAGWRPVMVLFGTIGLLVAALYWLCLRDRPADHPRCNEAEKELIMHGRTAEAAGRVGRVPLGQLAANANLWFGCVSMFFTNIGWVFIVTWLPRYFEEVHHVPVEVRGWIGFLPIAVGAVGMFMGGWLTDTLVRRIGQRWGRALPLGLSRFAAMAAYLYCLTHPQSPWPAVAAFAAVAFFTDLGIGAIWAYCQDIGGRNVGSVLGWANMWGNFGAVVGPVVVGKLISDSLGGAPEQWDVAFLICAGAFALSGITGLVVDATRPAVRHDS
jgi:nitrate/nitrite transporter NarK